MTPSVPDTDAAKSTVSTESQKDATNKSEAPAKPQAARPSPTPTKSASAKTTPSASKPAESESVRRLRNANPATPAAPVASIEKRQTYQYNTIGRRDPFQSMLGSFVGEDVGGDAPLDVGALKVVGIVWGSDSFALVEDGRGNSSILRRGDKVMNGYIEDLKRDAMVVKITADGLTQSVTIPLTRKGDQPNEPR